MRQKTLGGCQNGILQGSLILYFAGLLFLSIINVGLKTNDCSSSAISS